jgi:hypothetical protein
MRLSERTDHRADTREMIPFRDEKSYVRAVAVAVLAAISGVALCGHIPAERLNPFAGAIGRSPALAIALAILGIALFVVARPITALIGDRQKALAASDAHRAQGRQPASSASHGAEHEESCHYWLLPGAVG